MKRSKYFINAWKTFRFVLFNAIDLKKNFNIDDKKKMDYEIWSKWLKEYINRVYLDIENLTGSDLEKAKEYRVKIMNSYNPR